VEGDFAVNLELASTTASSAQPWTSNQHGKRAARSRQPVPVLEPKPVSRPASARERPASRARHRDVRADREPQGPTARQPYPSRPVDLPTEEHAMGRSVLLWLLGVPIPIIILIALFWR
jgi:hypothetical protein